MKIRIIVPVRYLQLESESEVDFDGFSITDDRGRKLELLSSQVFRNELGLMNLRMILENPVLYYEGESENLTLVKDCKTLTEIGDYVTLMLPRIIDCLWFVQDNSCFVNTEFYESIDEEVVLMKSSGYTTTTSAGKYLPTVFTHEQLDLAFKIYCIIISVIDSGQNELPHSVSPDSNNYSTVNPLNMREYNFKRHTIAINFFSLSRKESSPIKKITFLVAVLEALFSTKNTKQISRKVPERASSFIGLSKEHVLWMYETIHKSYGIRSDYIHGNVVISNLEKLAALCEALNEAAKMVLLKAFYEKDIFLPENKDKFGTHFAELVEKFKDVFPSEQERNKGE